MQDDVISQSSYMSNMTYATTISEHSVNYGPAWEKVIVFFQKYTVGAVVHREVWRLEVPASRLPDLGSNLGPGHIGTIL